MKEIRTSHIIKVFKNMLSINLKDGLRNNVRNWQQVSDIDREKKIELIHDMGKLNEVTQHVKENERRLISKLNVPFILCNGPCHTIFVSAIL